MSAAELATRVTHAHPEAIAAALLQARLVAVALFQPEALADPGRVVEVLAEDLPRTPFLQETLEKVRALSSSPHDVDIANACGTSPLACESVIAAQVSFLRRHSSFEDAVVAAASLGGDVDSICALVGCLAGALHGLSGIPERWLGAIAHESPSVREFVDLADALQELAPAEFSRERAFTFSD